MEIMFCIKDFLNLILFSLIYIRQVGTAAIQVCKSVGVDIIATAGSDDGVQMLKNMGVTKIYNHHSENYIKEIKETGAKIDVILEMLANKNLVKDLDIISSQGRLVVSTREFFPENIIYDKVLVIPLHNMSSRLHQFDCSFTHLQHSDRSLTKF